MPSPASNNSGDRLRAICTQGVWLVAASRKSAPVNSVTRLNGPTGIPASLRGAMGGKAGTLEAGAP
jgi:hypothetical protein